MKQSPFYVSMACSMSVVLMITTLFSACDPDENKKPTCRMTTVSSTAPWGDNVTTVFEYDAKNVANVTFNFGTITQKYLIKYEGDNITEVLPSTPGALPWATLRYTNDVLVEVVYDDGVSVDLTHNTSGQFVKAQYWYTYDGIKDALYNYTLTYPNGTTSNPSVVKFFTGETTTNPYIEEELTYDDKINPTSEWPLGLLFGISDSSDDSHAAFISINNITNSSVNGATTYTYNKMNYPTRVVYADQQADDITYDCN